MWTESLTPADSRVLRRKQAMRRRILEAAVELFVRQGYDATTVEQITELADVARTTFFRHFPGKEDVTHAWIEQLRIEVRQMVEDHNGPDLAARLRSAYEAVADRYDADNAVRRPMIAIWIRCGGPFGPGHEQTPAYLKAILDEAKRAGQLHADIDTRACGLLIHDEFVAGLCRWAAATSDDPVRVHLKPLFTLVLPQLARS